jgi:hypothetical protein
VNIEEAINTYHSVTAGTKDKCRNDVNNQVKACVDISRFPAFTFQKYACTITNSMAGSSPGCKRNIKEKHCQADNGSKESVDFQLPPFVLSTGSFVSELEPTMLPSSRRPSPLSFPSQ